MSGSAMPAVSVLLPVFNGAGTLRAAIDSILNQTWRDLELIVVDDGSSDDSAAIASSTGDPRVRVIQQPSNLGQTPALNRAIREARGGLLARQDADDWSHPERMARQVAAFRRDRDLVLCGTAGWMVNARGQVRGTIYLPECGAGIGWSMLFGNPFIHASVMLNRAAVERVGGYDETFRVCQDYDLWSRLLETGAGCNLRERLVRYRHHAGSLSHANRGVVVEETGRVIARELARRLPGTLFGQEAVDELARFGVGSCDPGAFARLRRRLRAAWLEVRPEDRFDSGWRRAWALQEIRLAHLAAVRGAWLGALRHLSLAFAASPGMVTGKIAARWVPDPAKA